jgi:hypothetical protein
VVLKRFLYSLVESNFFADFVFKIITDVSF